MKSFTKLMFAAALLVASAASTSAQDDLTLDMFHQWDGPEADAQVIGEDADAVLVLNEEIGGGAMIYGNANVWYDRYADVTGYTKLTVEGTTGLPVRVLMNRPLPPEGGTDEHGGQSVEKIVTIGDEGKAEFSFKGMDYVHINAIKVGWGDAVGTVTSITLTKEESVDPTKPEIPSGYIEMDKSMFHTWDGCTADAQITGDFEATNGLDSEQSQGATLWGDPSVRYTVFADISEYGELAFVASPGMRIRCCLNRQEPVEGGDANGGSYVEKFVDVNEDGFGSLSLSEFEFAHLNSVKIPWGGASGTVYWVLLKEGKEEPQPVVVDIPEIPEGYENLQSIEFNGNAEWNIWTENADKQIAAGGVVIGTSTVSAEIYADYSGYDEILIVCSKVDDDAAAARAQAPAEGVVFRVLMNREPQEDGQGPLEERNPVVDADGLAKCDISDLNVVNVNAIKLGWGQPTVRVFAVMGKPKGSTGIKAIESTESTNDIFDLQGRRVSNAAKGVYIVNGKKVVF